MKILSDLGQVAREILQISLSYRIWDDNGRMLPQPERGYPKYVIDSVEYRVRSPSAGIVYGSAKAHTYLDAVHSLILEYGKQLGKLVENKWKPGGGSVHTVALSPIVIDLFGTHGMTIAGVSWYALSVSVLINIGNPNFNPLCNLVSVMYDTDGITHASQLTLATGSVSDVYTIDRNLWIGYDKVHPQQVLFAKICSPVVAMHYSQLWTECKIRAFRAVQSSLFSMPYDPIMGDKCIMCSSALFDRNYVWSSQDERGHAQRNHQLAVMCPWCYHSPAFNPHSIRKAYVVEFPTTLRSLIEAEPDAEFRQMMLTAYEGKTRQGKIYAGEKQLKCVHIGDSYVAIANMAKFIKNRAYRYVGAKCIFKLKTDRLLTGERERA